MAFLSGYSFRQKVSINADAFISGNLTDQTVVIPVPSSNSDFWASEDGVGTYVRFTSSDETTLLKFEVESYDATGDDAWFHVKIPTLSSAIDTDIYIYYGHASPSAGDDIVNTWDSSFQSVYHLNSDHADGYLTDSTSNSNDLTDAGSDELASGQIDRGRSYVASNTDWTYNSQATPQGNQTYEMWIKTTASGQSGFGTFAEQQPPTINVHDRELRQTSSNKAQFYNTNPAGATAHNATGTTSINTGNWVHLVGLFDGTDSKIYVDGSEDGTVLGGGGYNNYPSSMYMIGLAKTFDASTRIYHDGDTDEVTISTEGRSADWVAARYRSGLAAWLTFAAEESAPISEGISVFRRRIEGC